MNSKYFMHFAFKIKDGLYIGDSHSLNVFIDK